MASTITAKALGWKKGEEFLHFAFGDFNTKTLCQGKAECYRVIDGDRYTINLSPPMQDLTADVPGGDGQYYFGTFHKPKVFDVNFAFINLSKDDVSALKRAFHGKEMRELLFFENREDFTFEENQYSENFEQIIAIKKGIYMAKVTGQPSIKIIPFEDESSTLYNGEGTVQFTAYWPYSRGTQESVPFSKIGQGSDTQTINYAGEIPAHFIITGKNKNINSITINGKSITPTKGGEQIDSWDSQTGIVKNNEEIIAYNGSGIRQLKPGNNRITIDFNDSGSATLTYNEWYY